MRIATGVNTPLCQQLTYCLAATLVLSARDIWHVLSHNRDIIWRQETLSVMSSVITGEDIICPVLSLNRRSHYLSCPQS